MAMTAAEAHATAAAEGLSLLRAENPTGFKNVSRNAACLKKPFQAQRRENERLRLAAVQPPVKRRR